MSNQERPKKAKVKQGRANLYLDQDIIDHFKHVADADERPYGPLINKVLRQYVDSLPPEQRYHNR